MRVPVHLPVGRGRARERGVAAALPLPHAPRGTTAARPMSDMRSFPVPTQMATPPMWGILVLFGRSPRSGALLALALQPHPLTFDLAGQHDRKDGRTDDERDESR